MSEKFDVQKLPGNRVAVTTKKSGLSRKKNRELVDLLRRNLLYQTPRPFFASADDAVPVHVEVRMKPHHHERIIALIAEAGGWTLPPQEKKKLLEQHEAAARRAHGDGVDYDFSNLGYGDLVAMHTELEGVTEMLPFREAIEDELKRQREERNG